MAASLLLDVRSEKIFNGGLLEHSRLPSALRIHREFIKARQERNRERVPSPEGPVLRNVKSRRFIVMVRDHLSSRFQTRAHIAAINCTRGRDSYLMFRNDVIELMKEPEDSPEDNTTLRYFLSLCQDDAVERHLELYASTRSVKAHSRKCEKLRPKVEAFTQALSLEFVRYTKGLIWDYSLASLNKWPYGNAKMIQHDVHPGEFYYQHDASWMAYQIVKDIERELKIGSESDCEE